MRDGDRAQSRSRRLTQVIHVDKDKCVNCHACIAVCPVKVCNDGSGSYVNVNADTCIGCGRCLAACSHGARQFRDDFGAFQQALAEKQALIAVVAPSAAVSFPGQHRRLNGWLKSLGVEAVFDVTFGAELCAWSHADYLRRHGSGPIIAQPCAAVATYIQVHRPELVPYLAPLDSPIVHTMKMVRRYFPQYRSHRIAVISPCPAKKRELEETGLGDYNVTYRSLHDYQQSAGVDLSGFAEVDYATPLPDAAVLLPMPGGLPHVLERWLPEVRDNTRTVQGQEQVYNYLATLPDALREHPETVPLLIDCLSCEHGCNCGPASLACDSQIDAVEHWTRKRLADLQARRASQPQQDVRQLEEVLKNYWEEGLYARPSQDLSGNNTTRYPSEEQRTAILQAMHKYSEKDLYNCCSCGYGTCDEMTVAIHNGLNRPENCHHYLASEREASQQQLAKYRDDLEKLVADRTAELRITNERLRQEIAERTHAEVSLEDSEQMLQDVIHGSPIPQFVINKDHRVVYWNKSLERLTGIRAEGIVGTNQQWRAFYTEPRPCLADLLIDNDHAVIARYYRESCRRSTLLEGAYEGTGLFPAVGSEERWLYFTAAAVKDSKGAIVGAVETLEDITESRNTEFQLARSRQAAEAANRAKSEFLANMSHEIRTPMTSIVGYADLIAEGCCRQCEFGQQTLGRHIQVISKNANLLLQVINDILDLSKIEAGRLEVDRTICSPFEIVSDVAGLLSVQAAEKSLRMQVDCAGPIPRTIQSDPVRLRQILINLLGNAIKFTERGEIRLVLSLTSAEGSRPQFHVDVIDTGVGMDDVQQSKLFQPFSQADCSSTRRHGGTGLGLTISRRLAQLLGGGIRVVSAPGRGSTFTLTVDPGPLHDDSSQPRLQDESKRHSAAAAPATPSILASLLLAEDGHDNQRLLEIILRKAGAKVALADNGQMAVEMALDSREQGRAFDLILMDMQMPVMDGYQAAGRLRAEGWQGPIVALTAHAMSSDRRKCLEAGCTDYLSKPFTREQLLALLACHIRDRKDQSVADPAP